MYMYIVNENEITMTAFLHDSKPETTEHLFWYCDQIFPLWNALTQGIRLEKGIEVDFSLECVLLR